ncbi:hypothetical protein BSKO_03460 [Bryopsis sp. KO-2023]|nr:hypothetical protein BSKO_03460 [Bryopsis sp. KO-2023]
MTDETEAKSYSELSQCATKISVPLANEKLFKKLAKLVSKAAAKKTCTRRGVKEVVKSIRKGAKGVCIIAGDVTPVDLICHVPILCEDREIPYIYIPSKEQLGKSLGSLRPTSSVLVLREPVKKAGAKQSDDKNEKYTDLFDDVAERVKAAMPTSF